ncbi:MAG: YceI family protein, partial [Acidimicrobiales bacterium]|nr:YceI family protein [Acidimicrobiales bacterium]
PAVAGEVRLALDRLASGNPVVDAETRRRIDVRHHPELVGTVTGGRRVAPDRLALDGEIAFRGEVQAVTGELVVERDGDDLHLSGEQTFDVRSWGLQPPRLGLLRVHPEVTVRLEAVAVAIDA